MSEPIDEHYDHKCSRCGDVKPIPATRIASAGETLCAMCDNQREKLAAYLSRAVALIRLRRIGEELPENAVLFSELPSEDQQQWRDFAQATEGLYGLIYFP